MSKDILFDNIIITEELAIAEKWAADTFDKKRQKISKESVSNIFKFNSSKDSLYLIQIFFKRENIY